MKNTSPVTKKIEVLDHKATGQKLRFVREKNELSLRFVAWKMEISAPFLSDLERGNRNWTNELVSKFNKAIQ